jgi:hypothetical protein
VITDLDTEPSSLTRRAEARLRRQLRAMAAHNEQLRAQLEVANLELSRLKSSATGGRVKAKGKAVADEALTRARRHPEARRLERKFKRLVKRKGGLQPALVHIAKRGPSKVVGKVRGKVAAR